MTQRHCQSNQFSTNLLGISHYIHRIFWLTYDIPSKTCHFKGYGQLFNCTFWGCFSRFIMSFTALF